MSDMTAQLGTLAWPYAALCDASDIGIDPTQMQQAVDTAIEWVWAHSGRRFGTTTVHYRPPTAPIGYAPWPGIGLQPFPGPINNIGYGVGGYVSTREHRAVLKLDGPVVSIVTVTIAGVVLDPGVWRQEGPYLVRQDGGEWPQTQNMITADGGLDTWSVDYVRGTPVSAWGQYATGKLVCWLAKQVQGGMPCAVPYNATTVTRGGVTINRDTTRGGKVAPVPEVDQWLEMVNPNNLMQAPAIWSPDVERRGDPFAGSFLQTTAPIGVPVPAANYSGFLILNATDPVPVGTAPGTVILRTGTDTQPVMAQQPEYLILGPADPVPPNTPDGTLILRTPDTTQ